MVVAPTRGAMAVRMQRLTVALYAAGVACAAQPAAAVTRVLSPSAGIRAERLEVAVARAGARRTLFLRVGVSGSLGKFGLVLPAAAGARLDPAAEGFFEALDDATAPRIMPPPATLSCGATTSSSVHSTVAPSLPGALSKEVVVATSLAELESAALVRGMPLTSEDKDALASAGADRFFLISFDKTIPKMRTETLRLVSDGGSSDLDLAMAASAPSTEMQLYVLDPERARIAGDELEPTDLLATWKVLSGTSDYLTRRMTLLDAKLSGRHILEAVGATPLFQWVLLPGGTGTIAPALHTYFARAEQAGQTNKKPDVCLAPVWDAREAGKQGAVLTRYCVPGSLAAAPGPAPLCDTGAGAGQIVADNIACGAADDFAAALSGQNLSTTLITRLVTRVAPKATSYSLTQAGTAGVSPISVAVGADTTGCSSGSGGSGGYGGYGGYGGSGNTSGGGFIPENPEPYDPTYVEDSAHTDVGFVCGGSAESDGACSGDSSSSSSEDSCSGDSSDSGSGDSACSGDTSDSSSGDACSGDSSGSTDGGGCSGDTSDGGGCSGDSGGGDCRLSGPRRRPRASIVGMGLAALALALRRGRKRRRPRRR